MRVDTVDSKRVVPVFTSNTVHLKDEPSEPGSSCGTIKTIYPTTVGKRTNERQQLSKILGDQVENSPPYIQDAQGQ